MKRAIYRYLVRERIAAVEKTAAMMAQYPTREARERYQVEAFNRIWRTASQYVPIYREWKEKYHLPESIQNLSELRTWPVLTKADLRNLDNFNRQDMPRPTRTIMTGGSTGEPVRIPVSKGLVSCGSQIMGRSTYGIDVGDRTFLLWGHEHLYGTGVKRMLNVYKRRLKDWLAGWTRASAYDLGESAMKAAFERFRRCRPEFVMGFSPAVLAFCRINKSHMGQVGGVKAVLCTAGPLTPDEKDEIERFFGAKVCMEYGSVEGGIIAYTNPADGQYDVFWNTHLIQALRQPDGEYKNIMTRLTGGYIPFIRYDIGDYLADPDNVDSVLRMREVKGRPSEMIRFASGVTFFGALIGDCVKQVGDVIASQIAVDEERDYLEIRVVASRTLSQEQLQLIANRFALVVRDAAKIQVKIRQVEKLFTTTGGKIPRVVHL